MSEPTATELESQARMIDEYADPNLTPMAYNLRVFLKDLGRYLGGVAMQLEKEHKDSEASTVKRYADAVDQWLLVPYADFVPQTVVTHDSNFFEPESLARSEVQMSSTKANPSPQPDLKTLEGAKSFLDYHKPDDDQLRAHHEVNLRFQELLERIWLEIPPGPGKTVLIRKLNEARMAANSAIANHGA